MTINGGDLGQKISNKMTSDRILISVISVM